MVETQINKINSLPNHLVKDGRLQLYFIKHVDDDQIRPIRLPHIKSPWICVWIKSYKVCI